LREIIVYRERLLDDIRRANTEMGDESEGSDVVKQMQVYIV